MIQQPGTAPAWAAEDCIMGIDEAGRGPVLGPMVYGVLYCPKRLEPALKKSGFADSKTLAEEKREALYADIEANPEFGFASDSTSASAISMQMTRSDKVSLNKIASDSTFKLVEQVLALGVNLKEVFCDTVGDPKVWASNLTQRFPAIRFTVCPKADALYPVVSAASIVAKVTRDRQLRDFRLEDGVASGQPFGCGYPGDPVTKSWLRSHMDPIFGFPSLVRFSWSTAADLLDKNAVKMTWASDEGFDPGQRTLDAGKRKGAPSSGTGRHSFFQARQLQRVEQF